MRSFKLEAHQTRTSSVRLECTFGGSSKFWQVQIDWDTYSYSVDYGRIGYPGTIGLPKYFDLQDYANDQELEDDFVDSTTSMVRKKLGRGYVRVRGPVVKPEQKNQQQVSKKLSKKRKDTYYIFLIRRTYESKD